MKRKIFICCFLTILVFHTARTVDTPEGFDATSESVGWQTNGLETPVNQLVTPAGIFVELPQMRPNALALSPDGKLLVTSGLTRELVVVNLGTGKILQRAPFPAEKDNPALKSVSPLILEANVKAKMSFTGIVFSPDGRRIFLSNVNGDLKVFSIGKDEKVSPLDSIPLPKANAPGRVNDIATGLAVSRDGKKIYVALNVANRLAELDAATGRLLRTWNVGVAPFDAVLAGQKIYVSNWGGRRPDAGNVTGPIGRNGVVRVDEYSVASEGSVSVIDLGANTNQTEILTGRHACALALSPDGKFLACANAGSDTVSLIDTHSDKMVETICARQNPGDLFGAQPDALAFDSSGKKLFVGNGTQNAVAVFQFQPGDSKLLGLIPVGWFPGALAFDERRNMIDVANIKSISPKMEPAKKGHGFSFNTHQNYGSLSLVPVPSKRELEKFTQTALANLRYPLLAQAKVPPRDNQPARPMPERVGEPGVFQHVIYIIKENRTYDQVLGDVTTGDGEADLCVFGARVTQNQHKFVSDFVLLDNTYCSGIMSAEGHQWTDSALANDYVERSYAGWPRSYPGGAEPNGRDAMAYSSAAFIWTDAAAHGRTVADFGEFTTDHHTWKKSRREVTNWPDFYRYFVNGANAIDYFCEPDMESLRPFVVTNYVGFDLKVPDIVLSHSKFWTNTCIFAIEDDPQDGWDHVSAYRTTAYVISPYTKRHQVVKTQYNNTSLLRTMELMLGLPPMNQMDATATPMFDCFTSMPDFTPYTAVTNQVPLDEMNPPPTKISDAQLRKDAYVSAKLPLDKEDQCPEDLFNRILWRAMKGSQAQYPAWAVKAMDDD